MSPRLKSALPVELVGAPAMAADPWFVHDHMRSRADA